MTLLKKLFGAKGSKVIRNGIWSDHPIYCAILGICSSLAITNKVENAIAMGAGVTFVLVLTAILISSLRKWTSGRVRMIVFMVTIASGVIIVDKFLQAFFPAISKQMGPYVGLIITNCIIMGRAEAFFIQNGVGLSILDGIANGLGYAYTLVILAVFREILAFGTLLGWKVTPGGWENWVVMAMAPGAFFFLAIFLWVMRTLAGVRPPPERR